MKKATVFLLILIIIFGISSISIAQENEFPVDVQAQTGESDAGSRFVYYIRENIRKSSGLSYTKKNIDKLLLKIQVMEPKYADGSDANLSVYSLIVFFHSKKGENIYYTDFLGYFSGDQAKDAAIDVVASISQIIDELRKTFQDMERNEEL